MQTPENNTRKATLKYSLVIYHKYLQYLSISNTNYVLNVIFTSSMNNFTTYIIEKFDFVL